MEANTSNRSGEDDGEDDKSERIARLAFELLERSDFGKYAACIAINHEAIVRLVGARFNDELVLASLVDEVKTSFKSHVDLINDISESKAKLAGRESSDSISDYNLNAKLEKPEDDSVNIILIYSPAGNQPAKKLPARFNLAPYKLPKILVEGSQKPPVPESHRAAWLATRIRYAKRNPNLD